MYSSVTAVLLGCLLGSCAGDDGAKLQCTPIGETCDPKHNTCCRDPVGAPMPCVDMGEGPTCISGLTHDDCPYFSKKCSETPKGTCGWDDPDEFTKEACQHANIVCGEDKTCVLGPPADLDTLI
uniref:Uncharacterized protein n=1 Tax=Pfiesteria piscicida TaxID=71001 RepID=A3E3M9_PFIPI|nr:unknown [Pfiesteria piscicida]